MKSERATVCCWVLDDENQENDWNEATVNFKSNDVVIKKKIEQDKSESFLSSYYFKQNK